MDQRATWRVLLIASVFILGWNAGWEPESWKTDIVTTSLSSLVLASLGAFFAFCTSVAVERSVHKTSPTQLASFTRLFGRTAASEPCGLAILRGTCVGLALLGAHACFFWLGATYLRMWPDGFSITTGPFLPEASVAGAMAVKVLFRTLVYGSILAFLTALAVRFVRHSSLAALATTAVALLAVPAVENIMGGLYPRHLGLLFVVLTSLILVCTFREFDLLTLLWTIFTLQFFGANYFALVAFEPTGATYQWIAFALWGLFVVAAGIVAFRSSLRGGWQRLTSAFE